MVLQNDKTQGSCDLYKYSKVSTKAECALQNASKNIKHNLTVQV